MTYVDRIGSGPDEGGSLPGVLVTTKIGTPKKEMYHTFIVNMNEDERGFLGSKKQDTLFRVVSSYRKGC